jgi:putative holliday junction resolvase
VAETPGAPGRLLGVDIGTRRVGLALSDPTRTICSPLETIPMKSEGELARALAERCGGHAVARVVIGLPVSADGSEGPGCARARRVAAALVKRGIDAVLHDESWTSRDAEEMLRGIGRSRKDDPGRVDALAASLILRSYLEEGPSRT